MPIISALPSAVAPVPPAAPPSPAAGEAFASLMSRGNRGDPAAGSGKDVPAAAARDAIEPKSDAPVKARVQPQAERCAPPIVAFDGPATPEPASPSDDASPATDAASPPTDPGTLLPIPATLLPVLPQIPDLASEAPPPGSLASQLDPGRGTSALPIPTGLVDAQTLSPELQAALAAHASDPQPERPGDIAHRIVAETLHAEAAPTTIPAFDTAAMLGQRLHAQPRGRPGVAPLEPVASATPDPSPIVTALAAPITTSATGAVTPEPLRPALPASPIDHIERLRDQADAVSTSIRLVPDALGAIDVSLKKDGEVTHVHLAADQPATRTLLADAQPRLAEIADQRGVRLGRTQVESGAGGQPSPQHHTSRQPAAPARTRAADQPARLDTHRIA